MTIFYKLKVCVYGNCFVYVYVIRVRLEWSHDIWREIREADEKGKRVKRGDCIRISLIYM